ncbi:deazaflavin-dependent oxidoreductase (nitroreductase family) [Asanoa ferruginea]|uniref:Deazaflavin-dependent oxidoreductase (Nitroreductase family) n=1 Tax=Asanoa ferruginea TaxID=53367 RepID=A0A3D9ZPG6_9ACTN|nr:nitroreductase family deazaflavin-dependent oxidoreductase [Asanoa ferruginea]REF99077.1 deazaflavin-dependent oxidoreductase (nitroreductase family) [Asanoa ferruginea]GIF51359.1 peptidase [Asanoa ferruginea]
MPVPRSFRKVGRTVNPFIVPVARRVWPLAVIHHVGRRSGRSYETPVMAFPAPEGWVVALIYGDDVQWLRNARGAGGVALTRAGQRHPVGEVRQLDAPTGAPLVPAWARAVLRPARVRGYVLLVATR